MIFKLKLCFLKTFWLSFVLKKKIQSLVAFESWIKTMENIFPKVKWFSVFKPLHRVLSILKK